MPQNLSTNQTSRIVWLDVLRLFAIFMVICIHCSDPFNVSPEARSNPEFNRWGSIYGSFLRPCVPLFVMITGILLLPVKMSFEDFYKKRLLRIAFPFLLWSVLYNLFPWITGVLGLPQTLISDVFAYAPADASQSFADAARNIALIPFQFNVYTVPMWYLYMLIGLYLYMPFFSLWVERATVKQKRIFLGLWCLTLFLPYAYSFFSPNLLGISAWNSFGTLYYFAGFNGYLLLGHYLANDVREWNWTKTLAVTLPMFMAGYIVTYTGFKTITANPDCSEQEMELFFLYCSLYGPLFRCGARICPGRCDGHTCIAPHSGHGSHSFCHLLGICCALLQVLSQVFKMDFRIITANYETFNLNITYVYRM